MQVGRHSRCALSGFSRASACVRRACACARHKRARMYVFQWRSIRSFARARTLRDCAIVGNRRHWSTRRGLRQLRDTRKRVSTVNVRVRWWSGGAPRPAIRFFPPSAARRRVRRGRGFVVGFLSRCFTSLNLAFHRIRFGFRSRRVRGRFLGFPDRHWMRAWICAPSVRSAARRHADERT